jgi:hypothetical protein
MRISGKVARFFFSKHQECLPNEINFSEENIVIIGKGQNKYNFFSGNISHLLIPSYFVVIFLHGIFYV